MHCRSNKRCREGDGVKMTALVKKEQRKLSAYPNLDLGSSSNPLAKGPQIALRRLMLLHNTG